MKTDRYIVTPPEYSAYAYWNVVDMRNPSIKNMRVATISKHLPDAEQIANDLAKRLNEVPKRYGILARNHED